MSLLREKATLQALTVHRSLQPEAVQTFIRDKIVSFISLPDNELNYRDSVIKALNYIQFIIIKTHRNVITS